MKGRSSWAKFLICFFVATIAFLIQLFVVPAARRSAVFGLTGSVLLIFPPIRQMISHAKFENASEQTFVLDQLKALRDEIERAGISDFMRFSVYDAAAFTCGALFLLASFVADVAKDW
ncbi:MAG TPA: hypothetical protein VF573_01275 [Paraburkholderia sp.]|uniref:hypothetical protein n=1 Tax=Paraburkholderia sp. TaxID=1926495 RepID=UPI002ED5411A